MSSSLNLIYGHDSLCGWCFGFTDALDAFRKSHPDVDIEVVPGGLLTGSGARPYAEMSHYILNAQQQLKSATGRTPSAAFHEMITAANNPVAESAVPAHAILQMAELASERVVEFAHLIQFEHFDTGRDLNDVATYHDIISKYGFPSIDVEAAVAATNATPLVAESFARSASLGVTSFPTMIVVDDGGREVAKMRAEYDPAAFTAQFEVIRAAYERGQAKTSENTAN